MVSMRSLPLRDPHNKKYRLFGNSEVAASYRRALIINRTVVLGSAIFCWLLLAVIFRDRSPSSFPGCGVVQIWSHRGHLESSNLLAREWTCDYVLDQLKQAGIRHFDVDVLLDSSPSASTTDQAIVAHPTEMAGDDVNFSPSPCSKLPLVSFLQKLKKRYGPNNFFVTMEPKSSWNNEANPYLAPPEQVVRSIVQALRQEPVENRHCGIIFQSHHLELVSSSLLKEAMQHCHVTNALRRDQGPLTSLPDEKFTLVMPTLELFGKSDGTWFLQESFRKRDLKMFLWVVDTREQLLKALQLEHVHGVVTNHPVKLKGIYQDLCQAPYPTQDRPVI